MLVLALAALLSIVLPYIDSRTRYRHEVRQGDVAQVAQGITLTPTSGWAFASGALAGHTRSPVGDTNATELIDGGADLYVRAAPFAGTPSALLTRIDEINAKLADARGRASAMSGRYTVTTRQGVAGIAEDFEGLTREGTVVAFVFRSPRRAVAQGRPAREGVEIVASGPKGTMARRRDDIVAMIRSVRKSS